MARSDDEKVYGRIHNRVAIFASLSIRPLDKLGLQERLDDMGQPKPGPA